MIADSKKRDSNIELARIVAMAMILFGHFYSHGLGEIGQPSPSNIALLDCNSIIILIIRTLCTGGVGLFMLISGYYGIKLRWKSIISFYLLCIFYNAISFCLNILPDGITARSILDIFLISRTNHWFFQCYWWIMLSSPILNIALNKFSLKSLRILVVVALVLTIISSWLLANPKGNSALFLFCLYFLGGYLRKENIFDIISPKSLAAIWLITKVLMVLASIFIYNLFHKEYGIVLQSNSPFVILTSVTLFLFFKKLHISSAFINGWASTVVAALFIQDMILYGHIYSYARNTYLANDISLRFFAIIAGLVIAIFIIAFLVEWPRKHIADKISSIMSRKLNNIIDLEATIISESNQ